MHSVIKDVIENRRMLRFSGTDRYLYLDKSNSNYMILDCQRPSGKSVAESGAWKEGPGGGVVFSGEGLLQKHSLTANTDGALTVDGDPVMIEDPPWECVKELRYWRAGS